MEALVLADGISYLIKNYKPGYIDESHTYRKQCWTLGYECGALFTIMKLFLKTAGSRRFSRGVYGLTALGCL
jgi:hypothetical protein